MAYALCMLDWHSEYVILMVFYGKSGYAKAPQCSVIRTLPLLSCIKSEDSQFPITNTNTNTNTFEHLVWRKYNTNISLCLNILFLYNLKITTWAFLRTLLHGISYFVTHDVTVVLTKDRCPQGTSVKEILTLSGLASCAYQLFWLSKYTIFVSADADKLCVLCTLP